MPGMKSKSTKEKHDHTKHKKKEPVVLPGAKGKVSISNRKGDPENGSRIFKKYCIYCHGKTGLGDGPIVIGLEVSPPKYMREEGILYMNDQQTFDIITYGVQTNYQLEMPTWGPILPESDRLDVIAYIKDLAKKMYRESEGKEPPEEPEMAFAYDDGWIMNHGGEAMNHGGESMNHGGEAMNHGGEAMNHGGESMNHGGESMDHGGESMNHGGEAMDHGGEAMDHGGEAIHMDHGGESMDHGGEMKIHMHGGHEMSDDMMEGVSPVSPFSMAFIFLFTSVITLSLPYHKNRFQ